MNVPNDLDVLSDGSFYATNFLPNMNPNELTKAIIGVKNGSIVHYDGDGNWQIVKENLCLPNGIWIDESNKLLFVANSGCHEVIRFEIDSSGKLLSNTKSSTKTNNTKITLGDNILSDEKGQLWIAAHPCPLEFTAHKENSQKKSPIEAFVIDPQTLQTTKVFQNNGDLISAASTAIFINQRLYISQVFDPFILVVDGLDL